MRYVLTFNGFTGVSVAYNKPYTPPSNPVLPNRGSNGAAAVIRVQNPSLSKVKLILSGGARYFEDDGIELFPIGPVRVPRALVSTQTLYGSYGSIL